MPCAGGRYFFEAQKSIQKRLSQKRRLSGLDVHRDSSDTKSLENEGTDRYFDQLPQIISLELASQFKIFHKERHDIAQRIIYQALRSGNNDRISNDLKLLSLVFEPR